MYLILIIDNNLILRDHEKKRSEFPIKIRSNCQHLDCYNKLCHYTINALIVISFSYCYASSFISYSYLNDNNVF